MKPTKGFNERIIVFTDIGLNLGNPQFDKDRDEVIERALQHEVTTLLITGTDLSSSLQAVEYCHQRSEYFWATAGLHPHDAKQFSPQLWAELYHVMTQQKVVAVGETGLDFNRNFSTPRDQEYSFERHIEAAITVQKPLFLHERDAGTRMIDILSSYRDQLNGAVIHCFTGNRKTLFGYLDLDLYIGITGWVCDERRGLELQQLVKHIPQDRLLIETDAPYLLPRDIKAEQRPANFNAKTRRNEPCLLPHIAATIASLTGRERDEIAELSSANAERLFRFRG